jgi:hypothetical protein
MTIINQSNANNKHHNYLSNKNETKTLTRENKHFNNNITFHENTATWNKAIRNQHNNTKLVKDKTTTYDYDVNSKDYELSSISSENINKNNSNSIKDKNLSIPTNPTKEKSIYSNNSSTQLRNTMNPQKYICEINKSTTNDRHSIQQKVGQIVPINAKQLMSINRIIIDYDIAATDRQTKAHELLNKDTYKSPSQAKVNARDINYDNDCSSIMF